MAFCDVPVYKHFTPKRSENRIRKTIFGDEPRAKIVLAYQDDIAVGFAVFFYTYSTFLAQPGLYLEDIYVRREARGRGVGRALFRYLAAVAKENGCSRIDWAVLRWNETAVKFYAKLGATPVNDWSVYRLTGEALDRMAGE